MTKKETQVAEYGHFMIVLDEHLLEEIGKIDEDPCSLSPEPMFKIAQLLNLDITYEELCE